MLNCRWWWIIIWLIKYCLEGNADDGIHVFTLQVLHEWGLGHLPKVSFSAAGFCEQVNTKAVGQWLGRCLRPLHRDVYFAQKSLRRAARQWQMLIQVASSPDVHRVLKHQRRSCGTEKSSFALPTSILPSFGLGAALGGLCCICSSLALISAGIPALRQRGVATHGVWLSVKRSVLEHCCARILVNRVEV